MLVIDVAGGFLYAEYYNPDMGRYKLVWWHTRAGFMNVVHRRREWVNTQLIIDGEL